MRVIISHIFTSSSFQTKMNKKLQKDIDARKKTHEELGLLLEFFVPKLLYLNYGNRNLRLQPLMMMSRLFSYLPDLRIEISKYKPQQYGMR